MFHRLGAQVSVGLAALSVLLQCSQPEEPPQPAARYTGDLTEMRSRGKLRAIVPLEPIAYLPRHGQHVTIAYDIARELAESLKLKPRLVKVGDFSRMMGMLLEGEGDIVVGQPDHYARTPEASRVFGPLYVRRRISGDQNRQRTSAEDR